MQGSPRIASRFVHTLFVLWAVATILFLVFRLMPGSPLAAYVDPTFTAEQQEALLRSFGLDRPLYEQYFIIILPSGPMRPWQSLPLVGKEAQDFQDRMGHRAGAP
jgi:hypothetical protein